MVNRKKRYYLFRTFIFQCPPVCSAAVLCALLIYTGILPYRDRHCFRTLLPAHRIRCLIGVVCSNPVKSRDGAWYTLQLAVQTVADTAGSSVSGCSSAASGRLRVAIPAAAVEAYYPGKKYTASYNTAGSIVAETGCILSISGRMSYRKDSDGYIFYAGSVRSEGWSGFIPRVRGICRMQLRRLLYCWGAAGGLLLALTAGSREYTDPALSHCFETAGLAHILALSGMHLSFFKKTADTAASFAGKIYADICSSATVLLFVWFAGLSPSLLRALLCMIAAQTGRCCFCKITPWRSLCAAFLLHCTVRPEDCFSAAFILSYTASAGIALCMPVFYRIGTGFLPRRLAGSIAVSVAAQLFTVPVCAVLFGSIAPAAVPASVCVSPFVSFFMTAGICGVVLCLSVPFLLTPVGNILKILYTVTEAVVRVFSGVPQIRIK